MECQGPAQIRVLLADEHCLVRAGVRALLKQAPALTVVGEASDGSEALRLAPKLAPDVLLIEAVLPDISGAEVARQLCAAGSSVRILGLSAYDDQRSISGLLANGAVGYLTKDETPERLIEAVRGAARGEIGWLSRRAAAKLVQREQASSGPAVPPSLPLTKREREVLRLLAHGLHNNQIAATLGISVETIRTHVTNIFGKLGLHDRAEVVAWAWEHGLVEGQE